MTEYSGEPDGRGRRFCLVASRFNQLVTSRLVEHAREELLRRGVRDEDIDVVLVPGAWELTSAARRALDCGYDGIVALGCVVRGETPHFEYICRSVTDGLTALCRESGTPITFGVLTAETMAQAMARAGGETGNQGMAAAAAALEMVDLFARFDRSAPR